jgi:hypothetical protein
MTAALADYQAAFAQALLADDSRAAAPALAELVKQPGFAVYRNTVLKGCIDALQANFPSVARLVGDEWFRAAAAVFVREHLPLRPMLIDYGEGFAAFLAAFAPAAELPYLPGVAELDRCWTESHIAADEPLLDAATLATLSPEQMRELALTPHAATRWRWFAEQPIYTIWSRNRGDGDPAADLDWRGEGALLTRPHENVQWMPLAAGGIAFLDRCAAGASIEQAALAALDVEPAIDLARLIQQLLAAGAFSAITPIATRELTS